MRSHLTARPARLEFFMTGAHGCFKHVPHDSCHVPVKPPTAGSLYVQVPAGLTATIIRWHGIGPARMPSAQYSENIGHFYGPTEQGPCFYFFPFV